MILLASNGSAVLLPAWMLNFAIAVFVQSTIVIAAGLILAAWLRRRDVATASIILRATVIAGMLCPLILCLTRRSEAFAIHVRLPLQEQTGRLVGLLIVLAWFAIALAMLARIVSTVRSLRRLRRESRSASYQWIEDAGRCARAIGMTTPSVLQTEHVVSPCLTGYKRPTILLPAGRSETRHDILLHEMAHVRRRDCLWHLLAYVATAMLWFQPLMWVLTRRLITTADEACDDFVLAYGSSRSDYARVLVDLAEQHKGSWQGRRLAVGLVHWKSTLSRRVVNIMDTSRDVVIDVRHFAAMSGIIFLAAVTILASLVATSLSVAADPAPPAPARLPIPDVAVQLKTEKVVRDVFGNYAASPLAGRPAIAAKMLEQGIATTDDPAARYVLLKDAGELSAGAGDAATAMRAASTLASFYAVDESELKLSLLRRCTIAATAPNIASAVATEGLNCANEAVNAGNYDQATRFMQPTEQMARASKDVTLILSVQARASDIKWLQQESGRAKSAQDKLTKTPADPEANHALGRYFCLVRGDWKRGLIGLSKGSNAAWQTAATADLANPTASDKQVAAGDMWWDLADKETAAVAQRGLRRRAGYWYSQATANPQFAGLKRSLVEKRLAQLPPPGPGEAVAEVPAVVPPAAPENGTEPVPATNWAPLATNGIPPGLVIADVDLKEVDGDYVKFLSGAKGNASFRDHIVAPIQANSDGVFKGPGPKNIETNFYAFFIRNKAQQTAALSLRTSEYSAVNVYLDGNQILAHREDNHNKFETKVPLNLAPGDHAIVIRHRNGWAANWIAIQVEGNNLQTSQPVAPTVATPAVPARPIAPNVLKMMDIHGNATTLADGSVRVSGGSLQSLKKYTVPFCANFVAKTDSTNIRISFGKGELIFNWEGHPDLAPLCFSDPAKGPGRVLRINGKGHVPVDQFVQITWIVEEKSTRILVNGEERLQVDGDYAGITAPLAIFPQLGSVVTVSSLSVTEGKSTASRPPAASTPAPGGNIFTDTSPNAITNSIGMKLVLIPAGEFMMGSPATEMDRFDNETLHRVKLTKPFLIATTTVTQAQWKAVMESNPSKFQGDNRPVETVSWDDAMAFCEKLSAREGKHYRLPTEAEWEYACRAGTKSAFNFGDGNLGEFAWYEVNSEKQTHDVATKKPNSWGLYDMHGNVWQWCTESYTPYGGDTVDPEGPKEASSRLMRGGCWNNPSRRCRSACRHAFTPDLRTGTVGFRVVLDSTGEHAAAEIVKPAPPKPTPHIDLAGFANSIGMKFIGIPPGEFNMGSPETEVGRENNEKLHRVKITKAYLIAATLVTQGNWKAIMGKNPSGTKGDDLPVDEVTWHDAVAFCEKLSATEGKHYRLPTEAEWEYAARAGTQTPFSFGDGNIDDFAWYQANSQAQIHNVATKKPNRWGLFDMQGNVWQWCSDWYGPYAGDAVDPKGVEEGRFRVTRGASYQDTPARCRAACRHQFPPAERGGHIGFRVCLDATQPAGVVTTPVPANVPPAGGNIFTDAPQTAAAGAIDLLSRVNLQTDVVEGKWKRDADGITSPGDHRANRIRFAYNPPAEYDVRVVFTLRDEHGGWGVLLAHNDASGMWKIDWPANCRFRGAGDPAHMMPEKIAALDPKLTLNEKHEAIIKVRNDSISTFIDGKAMGKITEDYSQCRLERYWSIGNHAIGLGTGNAVTFHSFEVHEVSGRSTSHSPNSSVPPTGAVDLLRTFDLSKDVVAGKWTQGPDGIASSGDRHPNRIRFRCPVPAEYDMRVVVTLVDDTGGLGIQFSHNDASGHWAMSWNEAPGAAFDADHLPLHMTRAKLGTNLVAGSKHEVLLKVRNDSVTAFVDGTPAGEITGDYSKMREQGYWSIGEHTVGIMSTPGVATFHSVELLKVPVEGATPAPGARGSIFDDTGAPPKK